MHELIPDLKKIAILRASAIGDFVVTLPALQSIRRAYPHAELVLLGKPWHQTFLKPRRTVIDRVLIVRESSETLSLTQLHKESFDIVLQWQGNGATTCDFINSIPARITAGFCEHRELDLPIPWVELMPEPMRFLEAAALLGADSMWSAPKINVLDDDYAELEKIKITRPCVVINPFANDTRRMYPLALYESIIAHLRARGYQVVVTGTKTDERKLAEVVKGEYTGCFDLSLGGLVALLTRAQLLISPDTGPLHLAQATGCPTVGLYWAGTFVNWGPMTRSIHRPLVSWQMHCPTCGAIPNNPYPFLPADGCDHPHSFVADLAPEEVIREADRLLDAMV